MAKAARVVAIIPARYGATRLPGKPLLRDTGRYLVQHVYEQVCRASSVSRVLIATDDRRILAAARSFGAEAVMTDPALPNGTARCAAAARRLRCDHVLNVQGDEPEVEPEIIDQVVDLLAEAEMTTVASTRLSEVEALLPQRVKVVLDAGGYALYFSRSRIPSSGAALLHLGIYGFRKAFLATAARLAPTPLSEAERLEQLRVLEHGYRIRVGVTDRSFGGIDTPDDYAAFVDRWKRRSR